MYPYRRKRQSCISDRRPSFLTMKKVHKYATGDERLIPDDAVYLCTKTETHAEKCEVPGGTAERTLNVFVWHYFLVDVKN